MSKESKPRDRWSQVFTAAADTDTPTPKPPKTPTPSVPPPRVHRGSSSKFHATRDTLPVITVPVKNRYLAAPVNTYLVRLSAARSTKLNQPDSASPIPA